jgi:hypothetical protein
VQALRAAAGVVTGVFENSGPDPLKGPARFLRRNRLRYAPNGFPVAEDDELSGILDHRKPSSFHLDQKRFATDKAFDIAQLSPDDATLTRSLRREEMRDPMVG